LIKNADTSISKIKFIPIQEKQKLIGLFYPPGKPILPHRLRHSPFAVYTYSFMICFLAILESKGGEGWPWLVNNPGPPELLIKNANTSIFKIKFIPIQEKQKFISIFYPPGEPKL
jgi:hypothetical protein